MNLVCIIRSNSSELRHHGTKGQKWGQRNYQNPDGTWTAEGQRRYSTDTDGQYGEPGGKRNSTTVSRGSHEQRQQSNFGNAASKRSSNQLNRVAFTNVGKEAVGSMSSVPITDIQKYLRLGMKAFKAYRLYKNFKEEWW